MADAMADIAQKVGQAGRGADPSEAVAALQGSINDMGDRQVRMQTPTGGKQARRLFPRRAVDGIIGPRTRQAVKLGLHMVGPDQLMKAMENRLSPEGPRAFLSSKLTME